MKEPRNHLLVSDDGESAVTFCQICCELDKFSHYNVYKNGSSDPCDFCGKKA